MGKNIIVRPATLEDIPAVHGLVYELAVYEKAPEAHTATIEDYLEDFKNGVFESQVAVDTEGGKVIGMILYYMAYSTWKGKMLYLEDFVVTETYRQYGVGQLLFDKYLEVGREKKCRLVKWQVLDWNEPALRFYHKNKAIIEQEWYNGKIFLENK
jgi:GNAT superfamily N-acetyltransferase